MKSYQEKLKKYLQQVPEAEKFISSGKPIAPIITGKPGSVEEQKTLDAIRELSIGPVEEDTLYNLYTQMTHRNLLIDWSNGVNTTGCNAFVLHAAYKMGATHNLGAFQLDSRLNSYGKGDSWILSSSGAYPKYGDIYVTRNRQHMGLSLEFQGTSSWLTVEGGQGGPHSTGDDRIKRLRRQFNPAEILGWCDMEIYLGLGLPSWFSGTWIIYEGDTTRTYYFDKDNNASLFAGTPSGNPPGGVPSKKGIVEFETADKFTITWGDGSTETFTYDRLESSPGLFEKMNGTNNRGVTLKGIKT